MDRIDFTNPIGHLYSMACKHLDAIGGDIELANKLVTVACAQEAMIINERDRAISRREYTEHWYAVRIERLKDLAKERGIWDEMAAIIANGSASVTEPPTYAQQLNIAKHRAEAAELRAQDAEQEVKRLRPSERKFWM